MSESQANTISSSKHNVPSRFTLLDHDINVVEFPELPDIGRYGDSDYGQSEIRLYTHECVSSVVRHTFYHELMHFLLHYAGRDDLAEDEVLVDTLGGLLAQYEATKRP